MTACSFLHEYAHVMPLSLEPLVFYAPPWSVVAAAEYDARPEPSPFAWQLRNKPVTWIRYISWTCETSWQINRQLTERDILREKLPLHRVIWAANTYREYTLLKAAGIECVYASHNHFISEYTFCPLAPVAGREFAAIYNAKFAPYKRHELLAGIPRLALIGYEFEQTRARVDELRPMLADPYFANEHAPPEIRDRLPMSAVNLLYNRASCGLALSAEEGAMLSAVEYLLAGLPVVTTLNKGGRDYYLDGRFSEHVAAEPKEIAAAIDMFVAQQIPPEFIRAETLRKQQTGRAQFAEDVAKLCELDSAKTLVCIEQCVAKGDYLLCDTVEKLVAQYGS